MKTYRLENGKYLGVSYFTNVENIKLLKENIITIFQDKSPVLINPKLILDPFQIVVAVNNAYLSHENASMKTKNIATEILFNLSSSKKIVQSLKDVGANDNDKEMIVALVSSYSDVPEMNVFHERCITGSKAEFSELYELCNESYIKSYYGITPMESENSNLLDSIITRIACKAII